MRSTPMCISSSRRADPDAVLDLQAAVRAYFDLVGYERLLDYSAPPQHLLIVGCHTHADPGI